MPPTGPDKPSGRANGVIPISLTQQADKAPKPSRSRAKAPQDGVKMSIRYLPPGMKDYECTAILGDEWKVGNGKVDWSSFVRGKQARTPGKPSRPAVVYLHLTKKDYAPALAEFVRHASWEDSSNTYNDPALILAPFVEKCTFQKIPPAKERVDPRQGTIDTDQDFMAFLEELANPKPAVPEVTDPDSAPLVKPGVTPLIEYLKAKKANKEKEAAATKSAKLTRQDAKAGKSKGAEDPKKSKDKVDKPKEEVRILLKKPAADVSKDVPKGGASKSAPSPAAPAATSSSQSTTASGDGPPKSRRAGIAAAARILQRDLGLSPGTAHRKARLEATKAGSDTKASPAQPPAPAASGHVKSPSAPAARTTAPAAQPSSSQQAAPSAPKSSQPSGRSRGRGGRDGDRKGKGVETNSAPTGPTAANPPILLKKRTDQATAPASSNGAASKPAGQKPAATPSAASPAEPPKPRPNAERQSKAAPSGSAGQKKEKAPAVTPGATRGFVKHANPSQGVTEVLLKQALSAYGPVSFVEIDKRKGFAYVDFVEHASLAKAVAASPVSVAQATVQVLERKDKKPSQGAASSSGNASAAGPSAPSAGEKEKDKDKEKEKSNRSRRGRRGGGGGSSEKAAAGGGSAQGGSGPKGGAG